MRKIVSGLSLMLVAFASIVSMGQTAPDPATMAQRHVDTFNVGLSLSSDQQTKAKAIFLAAAQSQFALHSQLHAAHRSLATAITKNDLVTISQISTSIGNLNAQWTSAEARAEAAFYGLLNPSQQATFNLRHAASGAVHTWTASPQAATPAPTQ